MSSGHDTASLRLSDRSAGAGAEPGCSPRRLRRARRRVRRRRWIRCLLHGAQRATKDVDLCVEWSTENLERVAAALRELDTRLKLVGYVEVPIDAALLDRMEIATWRTTVGDVDVLLGIPRNSRWELARYDDLLERSIVIELGAIRLAVASLEGIIRSKEIADRPTDHDALPELRRLMDEAEEP
jgi:hypothetical protein